MQASISNYILLLLIMQMNRAKDSAKLGVIPTTFSKHRALLDRISGPSKSNILSHTVPTKFSGRPEHGTEVEIFPRCCLLALEFRV